MVCSLHSLALVSGLWLRGSCICERETVILLGVRFYIFFFSFVSTSLSLFLFHFISSLSLIPFPLLPLSLFISLPPSCSLLPPPLLPSRCVLPIFPLIDVVGKYVQCLQLPCS